MYESLLGGDTYIHTDNVVFRLPLLLQFDSHRIRHGFTAVGDLEHCVHYKVGE